MDLFTLHATTVLGMDWYILLAVILAALVLLALALAATGAWKLGEMGRRRPPRA